MDFLKLILVKEITNLLNKKRNEGITKYYRKCEIWIKAWSNIKFYARDAQRESLITAVTGSTDRSRVVKVTNKPINQHPTHAQGVSVTSNATKLRQNIVLRNYDETSHETTTKHRTKCKSNHTFRTPFISQPLFVQTKSKIW